MQAAKQASEFKEQKELLQSILLALNNSAHTNHVAPLAPTQDHTDIRETSEGEQPFTTSAQANPLSQLNQTGGPRTGAAGNDS